MGKEREWEKQRVCVFFVVCCRRGRLLGATASCWKLRLREFTLQLVAVASGKGKRKGKGSARGACCTAWLLEGERAALLTHTWILTLQLDTCTC